MFTVEVHAAHCRVAITILIVKTVVLIVVLIELRATRRLTSNSYLVNFGPEHHRHGEYRSTDGREASCAYCRHGVFTDQQVQHQIDQSQKCGVVHRQADRLGLTCGRDRISPKSVELA